MIDPDCEGKPPPVVRTVVTCGSSASPGSTPAPIVRLALPEDLREPPVDHLHLAEGADHDVRRLEVAVDHAPRVGVGDGLADLLEDGEEPAEVVASGRAAPPAARRGSGP